MLTSDLEPLLEALAMLRLVHRQPLDQHRLRLAIDLYFLGKLEVISLGVLVLLVHLPACPPQLQRQEAGRYQVEYCLQSQQ